MTVGSLGRGSPGLAIHWAASTANVDSRWRYLGVAQALLALLLAAVASFMAAWCLHWAGTLYSGALASASAVDVAQAFTMRLDDRPAQLMPMLIVLAVSGAISAMGIRVGMGLLAWVCLPAVAVTLFGVLDFIFFYSRYCSGYGKNDQHRHQLGGAIIEAHRESLRHIDGTG